ncbi:stage II sporulation protein M [Hufsiella ginkgonis]|uniref:Stage II sporulation protein M n=1 Tax=Hufsiella ginkgonis TaxID=2695274 RepID=A0A7K1Y375_9SPHI|nr:stage II sporulation protein M [Hufsiella ginkgonis]MXV17558.1 stage II sporulation protein M [Hufsiella ginkgonis]
MREALFVKQNSAKWHLYDKLESQDPDVLAERFIEITDDLAYSKTFYPKSKTTAYLNGLASRFHQTIYKNQKEKSNRFVGFWKTELPLLFKKNERQLLYSFLIFVFFCLIGALSAKYDDQFVRVIMGNSYVNETNENIAKGDPFGIYKGHGEFTMFFMITSNNIYVAFNTFIWGIMASLGTVYHLMRNGIMLGSFQYYFFSKGLGLESVLVIWIHGTLEISAIVIAGGAGLVLGNSLLFPGTYTRLESFKRGAREGTQIAIGLVPVFIAAGFLESFITRHTEMPGWLSGAILAASFLFITWYVIIYPNILHRRAKTGNLS